MTLASRLALAAATRWHLGLARERSYNANGKFCITAWPPGHCQLPAAATQSLCATHPVFDMESAGLQLATIVSMPFAENTFVASIAGRSDCLVFDPGMEPRKIFDYLDSRGLQPAAIVNTHGHADHIAGNGALKERWPDCPLVIGENDAPLLTNPVLNLSRQYGIDLISPAADQTLADGETFRAAGFDLLVHEIPGHSPGHIVLIWKAGTPYCVFGGDVLFAGSIGRTDFPGGSFETLRDGIHRHLFTLPDDTVVLPGHGPATTIGEEKAQNPFVGRPAGYRG